MKNYKADLFIMIPLVRKKNKKNKNIEFNTNCKEANVFIEQLKHISEYECSDSIASNLERKFLGVYEFLCTSDDSDEKKIIEKENCYLFLTSHKKTDLHILTIMFIDLKSPITFVLDQISRENLLIKINNQERKLYEYLLKEMNFKVTGKAKTCICLSDYPKDRTEMLYLAAGEAYGSEEVDFTLISKQFEKDISKNIAQFDFCDIYASRTNIIQINKRFSDDYFERIYYETLLIFIAELILFKELAIHRTNQRVIYEIEKNSKPSLKLIEQLSIEFGSTIGLWNISNFRYNAVQCLAKEIENAFQINQLMDVYRNNQSYLEHIIHIRNIQVSEKEGKVLNFIAIMLTLIQTIPLLIQIYEKIKYKRVNITIDWKYGLFSLIILLFVLLLKKRRKIDSDI